MPSVPDLVNAIAAQEGLEARQYRFLGGGGEHDAYWITATGGEFVIRVRRWGTNGHRHTRAQAIAGYRALEEYFEAASRTAPGLYPPEWRYGQVEGQRFYTIARHVTAGVDLVDLTHDELRAAGRALAGSFIQLSRIAAPASCAAPGALSWTADGQLTTDPSWASQAKLQTAVGRLFPVWPQISRDFGSAFTARLKDNIVAAAPALARSGGALTYVNVDLNPAHVVVSRTGSVRLLDPNLVIEHPCAVLAHGQFAFEYLWPAILPASGARDMARGRAVSILGGAFTAAATRTMTPEVITRVRSYVFVELLDRCSGLILYQLGQIPGDLIRDTYGSDLALDQFGSQLLNALAGFRV